MKQRNHKRFTLILAGLVMIALSLVISVHVYAVDFTIIVLPDTQTYSEYYPEIFQSQTQWIAENKDTLNIAYVAHEGDIVEHSENESEWIRADSAMSLLDAAMIPYGVVPGNHDEPTTFYNEYFGVDRFCNTYPTDCRSYYGGAYPVGSNDNNYTLFSAGGMDFIVINLEYVNPAVGVLDWADQLLKDNIDRRAIVVSHYILNSNATFGSWGQQIYDALKDNLNLFLMLCGHIHTEARRIDGTLHTLLADFQDYPNGGNGFLRILHFSPEKNEIQVDTYSPWLNQYETDSNSQFVLPYDMGGLSDSLSYTPVTPCRIADTRKAWGALSPGGIFSYNVWGAVASQGGISAGCPSPGGEPRAVHLSVAAVPVAGQGHLRMFEFNTPTPNASVLSYKTGSNIANAITVKTCYLCTKDVNIQSFGGTTHVVIDVMGYYYSIPTLSEAIYSPITGHWYQLNDTRMEWNEAKTFAESRGGYLATITSAAEGQWLYDTFGSALCIDSGMRIFGGNDVADEGQWQWITGEAWSYSNWWAGEPNDNGGNEDCVAFSSNLNPGHGHYWNDVPTDVEYRSLIEYNSNPN